MRKILAVLCLVSLAGCASSPDGIETRTIYRPPFFGNMIGDILRVEDKDKGVVLYLHIDAAGATQVQAFTTEKSTLKATK